MSEPSSVALVMSAQEIIRVIDPNCLASSDPRSLTHENRVNDSSIKVNPDLICPVNFMDLNLDKLYLWKIYKIQHNFSVHNKKSNNKFIPACPPR